MVPSIITSVVRHIINYFVKTKVLNFTYKNLTQNTDNMEQFLCFLKPRFPAHTHKGCRHQFFQSQIRAAKFAKNNFKYVLMKIKWLKLSNCSPVRNINCSTLSQNMHSKKKISPGLKKTSAKYIFHSVFNIW